MRRSLTYTTFSRVIRRATPQEHVSGQLGYFLSCSGNPLQFLHVIGIELVGVLS